MIDLVAFFFWFCALLVIYVYCGYPALLCIGIFGRRKPVNKGRITLTISVLVPAHNEELVIENKIQNLLSQDYPHECLEIIVGSDGSTDRTTKTVKTFSGEGVRLLDQSEQQGKSGIQNALVEQSRGEVIVFTDADCLLPRKALFELTQYFADPDVGLVSAQPIYSNCDETGITRNESLYWRYESWLRQQESDRALLCMASGSLFAFRRKLWKPLDPRLGDDLVLPLRVAIEGFRNVIDPRVQAISELTQKELHSSLQMRQRIVSKDLRGLLSNPQALNPLRTGPIAFSLLSHKLLRWMIPIFLAGLLVSNLFLLNHLSYQIFLTAQVVFYAAAILAASLGNTRLSSIWSVPLSFCVMNLGVLLGTFNFVTGRTTGRWQPVRQRPTQRARG